jgi:hypothetical protein
MASDHRPKAVFYPESDGKPMAEATRAEAEAAARRALERRVAELEAQARGGDRP